VYTKLFTTVYGKRIYAKVNPETEELSIIRLSWNTCNIIHLLLNNKREKTFAINLLIEFNMGLTITEAEHIVNDFYNPVQERS
jgi:hypothetical protein